MAAALRSASVIVTATGFDGVLGEQQLSQVADGAILVNVGHSDRGNRRRLARPSSEHTCSTASRAL